MAKRGRRAMIKRHLKQGSHALDRYLTQMKKAQEIVADESHEFHEGIEYLAKLAVRLQVITDQYNDTI